MRRLGTLLVALLLLVSPATASTSLEARIAAATGIPRTVDAALQTRAAVRAVQIQSDFSHCCLAYGEAEIIAWNAGQSDPVGYIVSQWLTSPSHAAVLLDPYYVRIGCAVAVSGTRTYGVCLLAVQPAPQPTAPPAPAPTAAPAPLIGTLPNTAMEDR